VVPFVALWVGTAITMGLPAISIRGQSFLWVFLLGLAFAAAAEEILFRGFLLHGLGRTMGGRRAVLVGSALFAGGHVPSLIASRETAGAIAVTLVVLFGFAVLLCRIRTETGSIWLCCGVHALWNFVTIGLLGEDLDGLAPFAIAAMKLVPAVVGLVLAVRLLRRRALTVVPPMPVPPLPWPSTSWPPPGDLAPPPLPPPAPPEPPRPDR
jgi:membrane protease YdiL (CAAX protease family)